MDLLDLPPAERDVGALIVESRKTQDEMSVFRKQYAHHTTATPLSPATLHTMREGTRRYLDLQTRLGALAASGEPLRMALAAAVTLYDNYLAMLPLLADRHFRRLVNNADLGYGIRKNELWHLVDRLNGGESRKRLRRLADQWGGRTADADPLGEAIEGSATWFLLQKGTLDRSLPTTLRMRREWILDGLAKLGDGAMYAVSEGFGNAIGKIELRKGKLWQREDVLGHLYKVLRPLDLLLEKTPFRLTDLLIPGHFGHVAIWMGRPRKLRRLRVWKQEAMQEERLQECRPLVEEGRGVLEALRSGVELNPLRVFANVDDLAILRPTHLKRREIVESLVRGFQQVGKEYDFNFDVETTGTIVCSELPYHVYPGVDWSTEEQLGRFTISPDNVALEALEGNADFKLMAFYHDGALVPPKDAMRVFRELVGGS